MTLALQPRTADANRFFELEAVGDLDLTPGRLVRSQPREVYVRRRLAVVLCGVGLAAVAWWGVAGGPARRSDVPASVLSPSPAAGVPNGEVAGAADSPARLYVVQPGDTMWRIAERFGGDAVSATPTHWFGCTAAPRSTSGTGWCCRTDTDGARIVHYVVRRGRG
ncbi:MAG: LysM peptidoglycan-binding domain-containing protein [Ilumatobacteraceae bacterium]